jgi:hypothetical protein
MDKVAYGGHIGVFLNEARDSRESLAASSAQEDANGPMALTGSGCRRRLRHIIKITASGDFAD